MKEKINWKFEPFDDAVDPHDGYYTLDAGPLYVVIEPGSRTIAIWPNPDSNAVTANHTGFATLAEAMQIAAGLLEDTLKRSLVSIRQANGNFYGDWAIDLDRLEFRKDTGTTTTSVTFRSPAGEAMLVDYLEKISSTEKANSVIRALLNHKKEAQ